jgi:hypothetical protein
VYADADLVTAGLGQVALLVCAEIRCKSDLLKPTYVQFAGCTARDFL